MYTKYANLSLWDYKISGWHTLARGLVRASMKVEVGYIAEVSLPSSKGQRSQATHCEIELFQLIGRSWLLIWTSFVKWAPLPIPQNIHSKFLYKFNNFKALKALSTSFPQCPGILVHKLNSISFLWNVQALLYVKYYRIHCLRHHDRLNKRAFCNSLPWFN